MWLPPALPCAVLYLNDGQNVFADARSRRAKWRADTIAAELLARRATAPLAIVAIDHGGARRSAEYLPYPDPYNPRARRYEADRYVDALVDRLIPRVRRLHPELRDVGQVGIGGSSYGAIAALHAAIRHPGMFDRLLIESPPLWIGDGRLMDDARSLSVAQAWIGVGTRETSRPQRSGDLVRLARRLARTLRADGVSVRLTIARGATHHEDAWAARLPAALRWLFPA